MALLESLPQEIFLKVLDHLKKPGGGHVSAPDNGLVNLSSTSKHMERRVVPALYHQLVVSSSTIHPIAYRIFRDPVSAAAVRGLEVAAFERGAAIDSDSMEVWRAKRARDDQVRRRLELWWQKRAWPDEPDLDAILRSHISNTLAQDDADSAPITVQDCLASIRQSTSPEIVFLLMLAALPNIRRLDFTVGPGRFDERFVQIFRHVARRLLALEHVTFRFIYMPDDSIARLTSVLFGLASVTSIHLTFIVELGLGDYSRCVGLLEPGASNVRSVQLDTAATLGCKALGSLIAACPNLETININPSSPADHDAFEASEFNRLILQRKETLIHLTLNYTQLFPSSHHECSEVDVMGLSCLKTLDIDVMYVYDDVNPDLHEETVTLGTGLRGYKGHLMTRLRSLIPPSLESLKIRSGHNTRMDPGAIGATLCYIVMNTDRQCCSLKRLHLDLGRRHDLFFPVEDFSPQALAALQIRVTASNIVLYPRQS